MSELCIGIDLGGTFIKLAVVQCRDSGWQVLAQTQVPTPTDSADALAGAMIEGANLLMAGLNADLANVVGVGIGAPGPLDRAKGCIVNAPNLPHLAGFLLRDRLADALGIPAALENDANAAALGEYLAGAGREHNSLIMLTLGTGVGGGIVLDGQIWHGSHDFAGEVGHMIVQPDGLPCNCGQRGCLEQYASATFLAKRATEAIEARPSGANGPLSAILAEEGQIDAADVNAARKAGDPIAAAIWDDAARHLAIVCVSLARLFDGDLIVLAGGLSKAGDDLLTPLRAHYADHNWTLTPPMTPIAIAALGSDAGVIGAAGVAWQSFSEA